MKKYQGQLPGHCRLIAVSKTKPVEMIAEAYALGQRDFGENKVQELVDKQALLPNDIQWHMIGHLQRNKVKFIAPFVALIHAVDSGRLLSEINKQAIKNDRVIDCLLQVHIAEEESKFGWSAESLLEFVRGKEPDNYTHIRIRGLMGMATNTDDELQVRKEFKRLKSLFDELKKMGDTDRVSMQELSMGMTSDFKIAVEEGSTMVRIGTAIFGDRVRK